MGNAEYMGLTNTKKKMKFATIKLILSLITIGMVLSTNTMRSKAMDSGKGTWKAGYVCPKIFLTEGNGNAVDQGEATIMAPTLVKPNTPETLLGLNLKFKNAPAADSLIVKIGTKVSEKVYYIPFRFMSSDMAFNNLVRENKTLIGSFVADNFLSYTIRINLPYATFGWYINDDQSNKMGVQINTRAIEAKGNVSSNKSVIANFSEVYLQKKALLASASKSKADLEKEIEKQKKDSEAIAVKLAALKTKIEEAKLAVQEKQNVVQTSIKALQAANAAVTHTSLEMNLIDKTVSSLKEPAAGRIKTLTDDLKKYTDLTDAAYTALKKEISTKVSDLEKSQAGLLAKEKAKFQAGLTTSYPSIQFAK